MTAQLTMTLRTSTRQLVSCRRWDCSCEEHKQTNHLLLSQNKRNKTQRMDVCLSACLTACLFVCLCLCLVGWLCVLTLSMVGILLFEQGQRHFCRNAFWRSIHRWLPWDSRCEALFVIVALTSSASVLGGAGAAALTRDVQAH